MNCHILFKESYICICMNYNYDSFVSSYLDYILYELHYSNKTQITYKNALKEYGEFLKINKYDFLNINSKIANIYKAYLVSKNYDNKTSSLYLSAVRSFYEFLVEIKSIYFNPYRNIKNPKIAKKLPNFLNNSESDKMFSNYDLNTDLKIRNSLIIEFLYASGLRVSELCNIKLCDIDFSKKQVKVLGKGSKERIIFFKACDSYLLNTYLNKARINILDGKTSEYLFISKSGKPLTTRSIEEIVKKYSIDKNIKSRVTPHTLRHTYATDLLNNGADIRSVGELLGHESLSTTQIYTHVTSDRLKEVYKSAHPRRKIQK